MKLQKAQATLEDVSQEQMHLVTRIREELKEELLEFPDLATTWSLLRFCRARDFCFERVKAMLKGFVDFRRKVNFDRVMRMSAEDFKQISDNHARGYCGFDFEGRPIVIEKVGWSKPTNILGQASDELIRDYFVNLHERLIYILFPVLSRVHNKRIDRTVLIIDLKDVNILKLFDGKLKSFLKFSSQMSQDYYPELLGKSIILNAPWVFKGIWSIVKIWLDKKTSDKFVIESGSGKSQLAECMDINVLPEFLGGKNTAPLNDFDGPWGADLQDSFERKSFYLRDRTPEYQYFYTENERQALEDSKDCKDAKSFNSGEISRKMEPSDLDTMGDDDSTIREVRITSFRVFKEKTGLFEKSKTKQRIL